MIAVVDIFALNADKAETQLLAELDGVIAVLDLIHHAAQFVKLLHHLLPVDNARSNDVVKLKSKFIRTSVLLMMSIISFDSAF